MEPALEQLLQKIIDQVTADINVKDFKLDQNERAKIGELVQDLRKESGLTQRELANASDTKQSTVSNTEQGNVINQSVLFRAILISEHIDKLTDDEFEQLISKSLCGYYYVPLYKIARIQEKKENEPQNDYLEFGYEHRPSIAKLETKYLRESLSELETNPKKSENVQMDWLKKHLNSCMDDTNTTQAEVANSAGVSQPVVSNVLAGESFHQGVVYTIIKISRAFRSTMEKVRQPLSRILCGYLYYPLVELGNYHTNIMRSASFSEDQHPGTKNYIENIQDELS